MPFLPTPHRIEYRCHDGVPEDEASLVDAGLDQDNMRSAPLHAVQGISCFAYLADRHAAEMIGTVAAEGIKAESNTLIGGAVGRVWGRCGELQQIWVADDFRRQGIGAMLIAEFECLAARHGCSMIYLETFSFQAPALYRTSGYEEKLVLEGYPDGIRKYTMVKILPSMPANSGLATA